MNGEPCTVPLAPGDTIIMADGTEKQIADLRDGEEILALDFQSGEIAPCSVHVKNEANIKKLLEEKMSVKNRIPLSLTSDIFAGMKYDFDLVLERTIENMEMKGADEATITLKLVISTEKEFIGDPGDMREITRPTFKHDVSSVLQVKDKISGSLTGDFALVWDAGEGRYVMQAISDGQVTMFDDSKDHPKEDGAGIGKYSYMNPEE